MSDEEKVIKVNNSTPIQTQIATLVVVIGFVISVSVVIATKLSELKQLQDRVVTIEEYIELDKESDIELEKTIIVMQKDISWIRLSIDKIVDDN